jgi:hypothetical protein
MPSAAATLGGSVPMLTRNEVNDVLFATRQQLRGHVLPT